ncbi:uncharacterized protein MAM_01476 [Metarhizium album ARSEF 1941]|uniref:Uncharacterized protein n=1 Tax=Metarhizium album (strain ARSEF 1941) TaxID=1081103 RepID=A0A0B2X4L7_METAS|nr:uncharacterized protein MAM_01476 [Metarhizium album ARSEF 1941]KHO00698.1 hypothetical protein MAM_01476 [Metarhizium album ARSEF 1941]
MPIQRIPARVTSLGRPALSSRILAQRKSVIRWSSTGPATVVDTGFWTALIPKPLRRENGKGLKGGKSKEWNPATFFIVMFLFIGSMSIQMIALRNQSERYSRRASVRIAQLREALTKLQNGEAVDVEKLLRNAAESQQDTDWEEMLKAIERDQESQNDQAVEKVKQRAAPPKAIMSTAPVLLGIKTDDEQANANEQPSKAKPASLGNFF